MISLRLEAEKWHCIGRGLPLTRWGSPDTELRAPLPLSPRSPLPLHQRGTRRLKTVLPLPSWGRGHRLPAGLKTLFAPSGTKDFLEGRGGFSVRVMIGCVQKEEAGLGELR